MKQGEFINYKFETDVISSNLKFIRIFALILAFAFPFLAPVNSANAVVAPSYSASFSVTDDYINVSATLACSINNTLRQIDVGAVAYSVSSNLGSPQSSGVYDARGGTYVAWSASWIRPAITTDQIYSITVDVASAGVVCDQTGFSGSRPMTVPVGPLVVRTADIQLTTNGNEVAPDVVINWWGGTVQATYQVEYQFNTSGWQYFYTGTDGSRTFANLQNGRHSFRVKAKRGSIESASWAETGLVVGNGSTPTPSSSASSSAAPAGTPTPVVTIAPTNPPISNPNITAAPTAKPTSTALPTSLPTISPTPTAPKIVVASKTIAGLTGKTLSTSTKKSLATLAKQHVAATHVICTGVYNKTAQLATIKAQAKATCGYLKSQDKTLITTVASVLSKKTPGVLVTFKK